MASKIDSTLASALADARPTDPVQAVIAIRHGKSGEPLEPEDSEAVATRLIQRVAEETGESPMRYNVFRNLSSLAIEATPKFIRRLVEHDEVSSATANRQTRKKARDDSGA